MRYVIKFTNVSEQQLNSIVATVPCLLIDESTLLVPYDCIEELRIRDEDGDVVWVEGLSGCVVSV